MSAETYLNTYMYKKCPRSSKIVSYLKMLKRDSKNIYLKIPSVRIGMIAVKNEISFTLSISEIKQ